MRSLRVSAKRPDRRTQERGPGRLGPWGTMFIWAPVREPFATWDRSASRSTWARSAGVIVSPGIGFGAAGEGYVRCRTDIGAVDVQSDALQEPLDVLLAEVFIRAESAGCRAFVAFVDAPRQHVCATVERASMCLEHRAGNCHFAPASSFDHLNASKLRHATTRHCVV